MDPFLVDLAKISSALLSAFSILFAVYLYRVKTTDELEERFKEGMKEYEISISEIDETLSAPIFNSFGYEISERLSEVFPEKQSAQEFVNELIDENNKAFITSTIRTILGTSSAKMRADGIMGKIKKLPFDRSLSSYQSIKNIVFGSNYLVSATIEYAFNYRQIANNITNNELWGELEEDLNGKSVHFLLKGILPGLIGDIMIAALNNNAQNILNQVEQNISVLVANITSLPKSDLKKLRAVGTEKRIEKLSVVEAVNASLDEFDNVRYLFSNAEWDELTASRTLIQHHLGQFDDTGTNNGNG